MPPYKRQNIASVLVITNIICFANNNLKYEGFAPEKVIYDSPVKTPLEVKEAIDLGFHMNLDNEREVFFILLVISGRLHTRICFDRLVKSEITWL